MLRTKVLLIITALLFSAATAAMTSPKRPAVTKEQAATLAQQRYPGKIVKVQTEQQNYRIRVLQSDGRVVTVLVDGRSGQVQREGN
ncbi:MULTISPECIES: PepSY domain-containing protein [Rheinheimera]|uniref:PepSY domain-containing protein n=1 Tax=Rheinheimera TaxID=67575 RepID=UPI001BFCDF3C|nr:PepSY domain-containing protein [Rheinheimera oceanensis]